MLKTKLIWSSKSSTIGNKAKHFFEDFIGGLSLLYPPPTSLLHSASLVVKEWISCPDFSIRLI